MARKKLIAAAIGMLLPMAAEALTLGQVKVGSLLDQPLKAAIEVTADQPSELESLRVGLASAGEFSRKGIPRLTMLDDLRFEVVRKSATTALIVVTSREAVREPFVDFLMDATWADGQVTREYTLLLDPPLTADRKPPAIDIPARAATPAPQPAATAAAPSQAPAPVVVPDPTPAEPRAPVAADTDEIRVKGGDTLWSLASSVRPEGATVYQTMNALYRENPSAYGGNYNNMLKGAILRVPPADEIRALDRAASERMLAEHTRAWQTGTPVSSGSGETSAAEAPEEESAGEAATEPASTAEAADAATLRLASAGESAAPTSEGDGEGDTAASAAVPATEGDGRDTELVLAREEAASAKQEVANLRDRLVDMEERLMDAQRLLELKDEQLARLQAYYGREDAGTPPPAVAEATEPEQAIAAETLAADEQPAESAPATESLPPWRRALSGEVDAAAIDRLSDADEPAEAAAPAAETTPVPEAAATTAAVPAWRRALSGTVEGGPVVAAEDAGGMSAPEEGAAETADSAASEEPAAEAADSATVDSAPAIVAETEPAVPMAEPAVEPVAPVEAPEPAPVMAADDAVPASETPTAPQAAAEPAPAAGDTPTSRFIPDELAGLPVLPVLGGVAVAGLLGLAFLARRRDDEDEPGPQAATATAAAATLREEEANLEAGLALLDEKMAGHEWDDAHKTAESLLASSPDHPALNLRMLEILFARGDKDAFLGLANKLAGSGFGADHPLFWSQVESMGQKLSPGDTLFSPQRGASVDRRPPEGEDLDGMLDTLESHLDRGDETLRGEAAEVLGETAEGLGTAAVLGGEDAVEFDPEIAAERADAPGDPSLQEPPEDAVEFETVATLDDAGTGAIEPPVLEDTLEFDLDALGTGESAPDAGATAEADNVVALKQAEPAGEAVSEEDVETKLDLARAFLDLGDTEGARGILEEVVSEGNDRQREEASNLLQNTA